MALRRIDAETPLMPPAPPRDTVIMFGLTGYASRARAPASWSSTSTEATSWRASEKTRQGHSFKA